MPGSVPDDVDAHLYVPQTTVE
eukprot:SAG31_NODE_24182_length_487_cov_0.935567_2_plen_21_part_01